MDEYEKQNADIFKDDKRYYYRSKYVMDDLFVSVEERQEFDGDKTALVEIMNDLENDSVFYQL